MRKPKEENIAILQTTTDDCDLYTLLSEGVAATRELQSVVCFDDMPSDPSTWEGTQPKVIVSDKDVVTAAAAYHGSKVCVVNHGSATVQGGGASLGSHDQESALCRTSTLYRCLAWKDLWKKYYLHNRENRPLTPDMIYSPDIIVFKSVQNPTELLPDEDWFSLDVLTSPFPSSKEIPLNVCKIDLSKMDKADLNNLTSEDKEKWLDTELSKICDKAKENNIRFLILPKVAKDFPIDKKTVKTTLARVISKYGDWFVIIGKHDNDYETVSQDRMKELLYEQFSRNCQAVINKEKRQVVYLPELPKSYEIDENLADEAFHQAVSETDQSLIELYQYYESIFRTASLKDNTVVILPAPSKDCHVDEGAIARALQKAIAESGFGFETIEIALCPEYNTKKMIDTFRKVFSAGNPEN